MKKPPRCIRCRRTRDRKGRLCQRCFEAGKQLMYERRQRLVKELAHPPETEPEQSPYHALAIAILAGKILL